MSSNAMQGPTICRLSPLENPLSRSHLSHVCFFGNKILRSTCKHRTQTCRPEPAGSSGNTLTFAFLLHCSAHGKHSHLVRSAACSSKLTRILRQVHHYQIHVSIAGISGLANPDASMVLSGERLPSTTMLLCGHLFFIFLYLS
jgi:hypothetical protein